MVQNVRPCQRSTATVAGDGSSNGCGSSASLTSSLLSRVEEMLIEIPRFPVAAVFVRELLGELYVLLRASRAVNCRGLAPFFYTLHGGLGRRGGRAGGRGAKTSSVSPLHSKGKAEEIATSLLLMLMILPHYLRRKEER